MSRRERSPHGDRDRPQSGTQTRYADRDDAGRTLAQRLSHFQGLENLVVLALPRGGVPVAAPVAQRLGAKLGVLFVRKVGVPGRPELAMGALALVGQQVEVLRNESVIDLVGVAARVFDDAVARETRELLRRAAALTAAQLPATGRTAIVIDDGLATGSTMLAAVTALRRQSPAGLVVAVPVGSQPALDLVAEVADEVICPSVPNPFLAVGYAYLDFSQVADDEVRRLLDETGG